jgi:hypothetical protein
VSPSIISTTLGGGVPPIASHDTVRSWLSVPNNLFSGVTFSILKLDGGSVKYNKCQNINTETISTSE